MLSLFFKRNTPRTLFEVTSSLIQTPFTNVHPREFEPVTSGEKTQDLTGRPASRDRNTRGLIVGKRIPIIERKQTLCSIQV